MKAIAVVLLAIFLTAYATSMPASAGPVEAYTVQIFWKTDKPCEVNKVEESIFCINGTSKASFN
jgi:hypothetical protein